MSTVNIRLYDIFRKDLKLPDEKAQELVQALDEAVKAGHDESLHGVATKEFVKDEIHGVKNEIHRLELKIEQTKTELTKAIFWSSLIQFLAIVGSVIGIISFMLRK